MRLAFSSFDATKKPVSALHRRWALQADPQEAEEGDHKQVLKGTVDKHVVQANQVRKKESIERDYLII